MVETASNDERSELESLRQENARLRIALDDIRDKLTEPEEVIRAIRYGEIDALVVHEKGYEEIYSLQRFDSVYRTIVEECFPYGVWLAKMDGRLLYVTPAFMEMLGTDMREMREKGQFHFLPQETREVIEREWATCRESGKPWNAEFSVTINGVERTIWTQGLIAQTHDGLPHWVGVNIDITKRKQLEEKLRESDRRKDEFLATLAHELRNPLAAICTGLELMGMVGDNRAVMDEACSTMKEQTQQLTQLIDDLLDISRITSGKIKLRNERVEVASVLQSAVEATRPLIASAGHELALKVPQQPIYLSGDSTRLTQVISNLLTNAARYTTEPGHIRLSADRQGDEVFISVKDDGIGIPPEMLDRIFEMFAQVDHSLERSQGGLGIGLTLVKRLVELHDGSVMARSEGLGLGSEFVVRLPILLNSTPSVQRPNEDATGLINASRILVVDDNTAFLKMLSLMLQTVAAEVRTATDGLEALQVAETFQPDVVLMDIGMPKLNGYETARRLREHPRGQSMVLIALTGFGQDVDKQSAKDAGFDYHFVKPLEAAALQKVLAKHRPSDGHAEQ